MILCCLLSQKVLAMQECELGKLFKLFLQRELNCITLFWIIHIPSKGNKFWVLYVTCSWALVKDTEVAKKMTKYIELNTIGVSKDSQLRAAKVLKVTSNSCEPTNMEDECFFNFSHREMENRWAQLRRAVQKSGAFSVPEFPSQFCTFLGLDFEPQPGNNHSP